MRGTRLRVQTLAMCVNEWGMSPTQVAAEYELPEQRVKEALAFYQTHRAEIDAVTQTETELEAAHA